MPSWWDSLETVTNLTWWLRWSGASLTILGALCVVATLATSKRVETLKEKRDVSKQQEAESREKALQARLEAAEEAQKDRHLTTEQRARLLELLKAGPKGEFDLRPANLTESQNFGDELGAVLIEAGWTLRFRFPVLPLPGVPVGMVVQNPNAPRAAHLQRSLEVIGIECPGNVEPNAHPDSVAIYIGEKPKEQK